MKNINLVNLKGRDHLEDLDVKVNIKLSVYLNKHQTTKGPTCSWENNINRLGVRL